MMRFVAVLLNMLLLCAFIGGCAANEGAPAPAATTSPEAPPAATTPVATTPSAPPQASATAAPPSPRQAAALLGEDDIFTDFTIALPPGVTGNAHENFAVLTYNGVYAGAIYTRAHHIGDPYSSLMNNHCDVVDEWEEIPFAFAGEGPWRARLKSVVTARFESDDIDEPLSGRSYENTVYYLIFNEPIKGMNGLGEPFTYRVCYSLGFVTCHIDENGNRTPLLSEEEIAASVSTFTLKEESPYSPAISYDEMEQLSDKTIRDALAAGETPEARRMQASREASGLSPNDINDIRCSSSWAEAIDGRRIRAYAYESGGVEAIVRIDMDTGTVFSLQMTPVA